jgi:hypothetical protein
VTKAKTNTPTSRTGWGGYVRNASIFARITAAVVIAVCVQNLSAAEIKFADAVIVKKAERRIYLVTGGQVLKSFKISLGLIPNGDKMQEGDFRTPEGRYELTERNADSDYFMSIQISYPNTCCAVRCIARRSNHDSRSAKQASLFQGLLWQLRLDQRLHRVVECRYD